MKVEGFDWDAGNWPKCGKHGVSRPEIELVLSSQPVIAPDSTHSGPEDRFIAVGRNAEGRPLFIGFTFRRREERRLVRPITARYMHDKEARRYAAQSAEDDHR